MFDIKSYVRLKAGKPHSANQKVSKLSSDGFILLYIPAAKWISV